MEVSSHFFVCGGNEDFCFICVYPTRTVERKTILYVLVDMIAGVICIALCLLPYAGREDYVQSTSILNDVMVSRMFSTTFVGGNTEIPAFLAILVALSIYAYAAKVENKDEYFYHTIWITLAVFCSLFYLCICASILDCSACTIYRHFSGYEK